MSSHRSEDDQEDDAEHQFTDGEAHHATSPLSRVRTVWAQS